MKERLVQLEVLRYDPEKDPEPHFQRYEVMCKEEWVVLDALNAVKESLDPTLAYRWSCHMAVCGSCGMMVNGEPKLSCHAFLRDYEGVIRVEPLANFPIERDLVTVADDRGYEWEVSLIDDPKTANAFALPGGKMAVYSGILPVCKTEAGLAVASVETLAARYKIGPGVVRQAVAAAWVV